MLTATIISDKAAEWLWGPGYRPRILAWQTCGAPDCGVVVWAGVRRRRDARYCSAKCRTRAYRGRVGARAARESAHSDHDGEPSPVPRKPGAGDGSPS